MEVEMARQGYYLHPTIHGDKVVFASDDQLWSVPASGGLATRMTQSRGIATRPRFSPDGKHIAYIAAEEGYPEIYVMDAEGGTGTRLTRLAAPTLVLGWTADSASIVFSTIGGRSNRRLFFVHTVPAGGGPVEELPVGPAVALSFGPGSEIVIGRGSGLDPSWWKRYRGGRIGEIWIDRDGRGEFEKLIETGGNLANPMWMGSRVYFHSDHEGVGNLYSCLPSGEELRRHTDHEDFYLRSPCCDGARIVYCAGGDLHLFDPSADRSEKIEVDFPSQRPKKARRFVSGARSMEDFDLHPEGHSLCITARGKPFKMAHWEGAPVQLGEDGGRVRYRLASWLGDGKRVLVVSDEGDEEALELYGEDGARLKRLDDLDVGRPVSLMVSPAKDEAVLSNHRGELIHVDLEAGTSKVLAASKFGRIAGYDISRDGRWVAFGFPESQRKTGIRLCDLETGDVHRVAEPVMRDTSPSFDPDGKYLCFLSYSGFDPVRDVLDFAYGFPRGIQLKLVTLKKDQLSPLVPVPKAPGGPPAAPGATGQPAGDGVDEAKKGEEGEEKGEEKPPGPPPLEVDLEGLDRRVVLFPVAPGEYYNLVALAGGKVLFQSQPVQGLLGRPWLPAEPEAKASLVCFDFEKGKEEVLVSGITTFDLDPKRKVLAYQAGRKLRVIPAGQKPPEEPPGPPSRKNGWIDLDRIRISVDFQREWTQMLTEGWRLLRDHYYSEDMGGCDWGAVLERYRPLVKRVSTRRELSDVFWEMGGELGTSHAYELGGDYPPETRYPQGFLASDFAWRDGEWRVERIVQGDPGEPGLDSPLNAPGINVKEGDVLLAVNGLSLRKDLSPEELLVNRSNQDVALTFRGGDEARTVTVKAMASDMGARHREWVAVNTKRVHEETGDQVGYIHLSDMGAQGFSEFHRAFLTEVDHDALIVDVRYNSGGHVSPLILSRLMRFRTGFGIARWQDPYPRPPDSFTGPIVCVTDEFSGSDGDMFSHNFKQLGVGPLIGKRTWGGIVGLSPTHPLVDGTVTTQPEYFNWVSDIGYDLENRGAEPDILVEIKPQDYVKGRDPQLEKAIEVGLDLLEKNPPASPDLEGRPDRSLPKLPPRA